MLSVSIAGRNNNQINTYMLIPCGQVSVKACPVIILEIACPVDNS